MKRLDFLYSDIQFGLWRIIFGFYLLYYTVRMIPYTTETYFKNEKCSVFSILSSHPNFNLNFPVPLLEINSFQLNYLFLFSALFSFLIMIGYCRPIAAVGFWFVATWLVKCAPNITSIEVHFVNWFVLIIAFIPNGERFSLSKRNMNWYMPKAVYWGAWVFLTVSLSFAGYTKLIGGIPGKNLGMSETWSSGEFLFYFFNTQIYRHSWFGDSLTLIPMGFYKAMSYLALAVETGSFLCLFNFKVRSIWWILTTSSLFLGVILLNIHQIMLGMIIGLLFVFDVRWFKINFQKVRHLFF